MSIYSLWLIIFFQKMFKVVRVVEIFKMWYFVIFDGKINIYYLKYWYVSVENDCYQQLIL